MAVLNIHERALPASEEAVGALIDSLGGENDRLRPRDWPPIHFERPLAVGVTGGHGPVRYVVSHYVPGRWARFTFTGPRGFQGFHEYAVEPLGENRAVLRNTLVLHARGVRWLGWLLFFRPLHDAMFEDALDRAEQAMAGHVARPATWSPYVRLLRATAARLAPRLATGVTLEKVPSK
ncbi:SRPBCC family protein [Streptomyces sp. NPDC051207]|uniref:SRPBCC family protein n=1 Tax=Streptomyces sp. NPDC051207 TaxID=3154641 RepID=UPI0034145E61